MEEFDFLHHLCVINSNSTEKIIIFSAFFTLNQEKTKEFLSRFRGLD